MRAGWMTLLVFGLTAMGASARKPAVEKITLKNATGQDVGMVTFKQLKTGVRVKIELKDLPVGVHGVHIHQNPVCEGPDFKSAGPHFNPDGKMHGFENPLGHHNGDLPQNVTVQENHRGEATFVVTSISLDPTAANSLFAHGGTSVVVHEKADDMKTDPSGNSGNRIACAVLNIPAPDGVK